MRAIHGKQEIREYIRKVRCPDKSCMADKEYLDKCCNCPDGIASKYYWCNSHQRSALICLGGAGGILLPCAMVDLRNEIEIED